MEVEGCVPCVTILRTAVGGSAGMGILAGGTLGDGVGDCFCCSGIFSTRCSCAVTFESEIHTGSPAARDRVVVKGG